MDMHTSTQDGHTLLHLRGRFDAHEAPTFRDRISRTAGIVIIDLSSVTFVDSTALAELVRAQRAAESAGGRILLAQPSTPVRVILELTAIDRVFVILDDKDAAPTNAHAAT